MKKRDRILALAMTLLISAAVLGACTSPAPAAPTQAPAPTVPAATPAPAPATPPAVVEGVRFAEEIDIIIDANPLALIDPFRPGGPGGPNRWAYTLIYDTLMVCLWDQGFDFGLATSYETDDFQTITMTLRDDVYFHNGDKFTAQDVVNTVLLGHASPGTMGATPWRNVATATAIDTYVVEFVLHEVDVDFFALIAHPGAGIINQRAIDEDRDRGIWIGTGAFYVAEFHANDFTVFHRNDNFWGGEPPTQRIILRFVPEMSARTIMIQNDQSQVSFGTNPADMDLFTGDPENFVVFPYVMTSTNYLSFNMNDPITGCWYFRRAVAHAVNLDEVAMVAMGAWAQAWEGGSIWGYGTEFRNTDIPNIPFDLDTARSYLERSVWNGESVEITASQAQNIRASELIQQHLSLVGIPVTINQVDTAGLASHASYQSNHSQMVAHVGTMTRSASSIRNLIASGAATNRASYNNPVIEEMLVQAGMTVDAAEREAIYREIQEIIAHDLPYINTYNIIAAPVGVRGIGGMFLRNCHSNDLRFIYRVLD